ncbi:MAG TPA: biotin/lipoyl-containing protein [Vicinamibacterales bacterium]|nr:biotin/lipoyl-containing protein [Vicinamibacterales bacterium]
MRYEVDIGGQKRQVSVARSGDGFAVTLDGRTFQIDAARIDGHTLSLLVDRVWPSGRSPAGPERAVHDVTVAPGTDGAVIVRVGTTPIPVTVDGRRLRARGAAADAGSGPQRIVAPMPGKVVRVLAAAGDAVKARQPMVVVEAMKMENELRAERDGTVAEVHAREGQLVDAGTLLIVLK